MSVVVAALLLLQAPCGAGCPCGCAAGKPCLCARADKAAQSKTDGELLAGAAARAQREGRPLVVHVGRRHRWADVVWPDAVTVRIAALAQRPGSGVAVQTCEDLAAGTMVWYADRPAEMRSYSPPFVVGTAGGADGLGLGGSSPSLSFGPRLGHPFAGSLTPGRC